MRVASWRDEKSQANAHRNYRPFVTASGGPAQTRCSGGRSLIANSHYQSLPTQL